MIEIKNIFKKYRNKNVVEDVSFNIEKGKITSFIGPNGAGKSTVLSIVTRLISGDGGEIIIEGKELKSFESKELAKKIAILKQSNNITLKLTIRELVSFGRFPHSEGNLTLEDEKHIDEAIAYMKLTDIQDKYQRENDVTVQEKLRQDYDSLNEFVTTITNNQSRVFDFQLHIMITADSKEELERKKIQIKVL